MIAASVRTVIVSNPDLAALHTALDKLRDGQALTALESGVAAEASIKGLTLVEPIPPALFDGIAYTQFLYVTTS